MYEETACFDPNTTNTTIVAGDDVLHSQQQQPQPEHAPLVAGSSTNSHSSFEDYAATNNNNNINISLEDLTNSCTHNNNVVAQEDSCSNMLPFNSILPSQYEQYHSSSWDPSSAAVNETMQQMQEQGIPYPPTPEILNLFQHLPKFPGSGSFPNSSSTLSFTNSIPQMVSGEFVPGSPVLFDPLYHMSLPPQPQPPLMRELFQSLPHNGCFAPRGGGSLFVGGDDVLNGDGGSGGGIVVGDGNGSNGVFEFTQDIPGCIEKTRGGVKTKHFTTERQRRQQFNDKYTALRSLIPNPTKSDRASVVGDAIEYIKELLRTVDELKILVEKKRCGRERMKRIRTEEEGNGGDGASKMMPNNETKHDQSYNNGSLRSSWLQRKSKDTEVDVRIIDDEVTIKLVQRRKVNCLLLVSKVLDELQLDLHHVAGGHIGHFYSFLFNSKIYEGSSVYASAIANKLIEVVDRQYDAGLPNSCCY